MDQVEFWRWLHILLFVFWLGADVGVFTCGVWLKRPGLTPGERLLLLRVSSVVDLLPRMSAALMLPVGTMLARNWVPAVDATWVAFAWSVALAWLALTFAGIRTVGTPAGARVSLVTHVFLVLLAIVCFVASVRWRGGAAPGPAWVADKLALYGLVCLLAIGIEVAFRPVVAGFARLAAPGEAAAGEAQIARGMNVTLGVVATLYVVVLVASFLGTAKPG